MKRITIYLSILAAGLSLSSCDGFLDQPAQGQMTEGDFLGNSNSAASLTNSIYATYREGSTYETTGSWIGDLCSDNALRGSSMSDGGGTIYNNGTNQFQNLSGLTGSSAFLNWLWLNAYTGIGRANTALRTIDTFEGLAPRQKEILQGEACFNRAWFYFVVLKLWGKGPIVPLETLSGAEQAALKISDRTALYDTIVADLQIALKMPDKAESAKWYPTSWYGRAHKGSAQGLLAKVLLYRAADDPANAMQYYQQIVQIVKDMESSTDGYDLIAVDNIFTKAGEYSVESVFEIGAASFTTSDGAYQGWQLLGTRGEPNWGWGYIAPSLNLVQSYEPGDKRKDNDIIYGKTTIYSGMVQTQSVIDGTTIIGAYSESDPNSVSNGYPNRFCRKGYQPRPVVGGNENYGGNIRMMRWAEVLLIGAEAAVRTGDLVQRRPHPRGTRLERADARKHLGREADRTVDGTRPLLRPGTDRQDATGLFRREGMGQNPVRTTGPRRDESARLGPGIDHAAAAAGFARSRSEKLRNAGAERTDPADEQPQTE